MTLKQLAAAAAFACAAPAFAGINTFNGDAELFGVVWDENVATYAIDFGLSLSALASLSGTMSYDVAGANWTAYAAADTNMADFGAFEGTRWAVIAVDDDGFSFIDGDLNFLSTTTDSVLPTLNNSFLDVQLIGWGQFGQIGYFNQNGMTPDPAANLDLFAAKGSPAHVIEAGVGPFVSTGNAVGSGFQSLFTCSHTNFGGIDFDAACAAMTNGAGDAIQVAFDGTSFQVAAVPEPGTYAMLFAGLMAIGAVVRRRA